MSLIKTGSYEEGLARLKALEQANPNVAGLHTTMGETYADQGIYRPAIDEYKKSLAFRFFSPEDAFPAGSVTVTRQPASGTRWLNSGLPWLEVLKTL